MAESTPLERAALYRFLAEGFWGPPAAEWLADAADLPELAPHLRGDLAAVYTEAVGLNVYPYASVYLDPSGMLDAPWTAFTAGVYRALGLAVTGGSPDHLSAHFEALALLLEREAAARAPVDAVRARHAQITLLTGHLLPWLPCFALALGRADAGLYAALARLALEAVLGHAEAAIAEAPPFAFPEPEGEPPTFSAGRRGASEARRALQSLLTPARSGLFLSRADIRRVAGSLGVGARFGERSFMLEGVLNGAAELGRLPAALGALAGEARAQAEGYAGLSAAHPALGPLWVAWREKLAATEAEVRGASGEKSP